MQNQCSLKVQIHFFGCFRPLEWREWAAPRPLHYSGCHSIDICYLLYFPQSFRILPFIWVSTVIRCQLSESFGVKSMLFFIQLLPAWSCIQMAGSKGTELCIPYYSTELAKCREQGREYSWYRQGSKGGKRTSWPFKWLDPSTSCYLEQSE